VSRRPPLCGCSHEQTRHALVDVGGGVTKHAGSCSHGCGCPGFHRRRWGLHPAVRDAALPVVGPVAPDPVARVAAAMNELRDALVAALRSAPVDLGNLAAGQIVGDAVDTEAAPWGGLFDEVQRRVRKRVAENRKSPPSNGSLPKGELVILTAVAQHSSGVDRPQLTALTGYKRSTRDAYLQRLMDKEMIHEKFAKIWLNTAGAVLLGSSFKPLPTGDALLRHWLEKLPQGESLVLSMLARCYPEPVTRERVTESTGYKRSTRDAYLQRLEKRKLVELAHGTIVASRHLFDEKKTRSA